jgi:uncharacterized membrane protein
MKKWLTSFFLLALLLVFPSQGLAVEFSISNVEIDAYLQVDGRVEVEERHTYDFEGEFNGITREVIPKEGANITGFSASEDGKSLRVEEDDGLYKIHRKGADESISVTLHYFIENGIEVYKDVAQFYWPFFDSRNESTYENLLITIHPPDAAEDVIAFGYEESFQTEKIQEDGSVRFQLGEVPSETNGDIRVAYNRELFPAAAQTSDKMMKAEIIKVENELIEQAEADEAIKNKLSTIAAIGIPTFSLILLFLMIGNWLKARTKRADFLRDGGAKFLTLPKQIMSLPATIYFTNHKYLSPQAMAAAFLDLIRQGYVSKTSDSHYQRTGQKSPLNHENVLMEWLFQKIGKNNQFEFDDLTTFTNFKKNHAKYQEFQTEWRQAIKEEFDTHLLYEKKTRYRLFLGLSSIILLPFGILFFIYELFVAFFVVLLLFLTVIIYAIAYRPMTLEGARISFEWKEFQKRFRELPQTEWEKWSEDDRMRAIIYGLGIGDKSETRKTDDLLEAFTPYQEDTSAYYTIIYASSLAHSSFQSANETTTISTSSSSSSSGGGGTGGGGGGSGAF